VRGFLYIQRHQNNVCPIQFYVTWDCDKKKETVKQNISVEQGCSLTSHQCNLFTNNVVDQIREKNDQRPTVGTKTILGLLFADYLSTQNVLQ
jgi:hypothetical protein